MISRGNGSRLQQAPARPAQRKLFSSSRNRGSRSAQRRRRRRKAPAPKKRGGLHQNEGEPPRAAPAGEAYSLPIFAPGRAKMQKGPGEGPFCIMEVTVRIELTQIGFANRPISHFGTSPRPPWVASQRPPCQYSM